MSASAAGDRDVVQESEEVSWEALAGRVGSRYLSLSETKKILRKTHKLYLSRVESLSTESGQDAWERGALMLEAIPLEEMICLHGVVTLYTRILLQLGRQQEAIQVRLEQLLRVDHEELWLQYGHLVLSWLYGEGDPADKQTFLERLDQLCQKTQIPIPHLIWLDVVEPLNDEAIDQIAARYRRALTPGRWRGFSGQLVVWLPVLHRCLSSVAKWLWVHERKKQATTFVKMINRFPWELWEGGLPGHQLATLCSMMTHLKLWDDVIRLCEKVRSVCLEPPVVCYWLGFVSFERGDSKKTSDYFREALQYKGSLDDFLLLEFVRHFLKQQELSDMKDALALLSDQNSLETLHYWLSFSLLQGDYDEALRLSEKIQSLAPEDVGVRVRRWLLLEAMENDESLLEEISPSLEKEDSEEKRVAIALMGLLDARAGRYELALERLESVKQGDVLGDGWDGRDLWARVLEERGFGLRARGENEEALVWLVRALDFHPTEWRYHQLLTVLIQEGHFEEAMSWWEQGQERYPNSMQICYARFLIAEHEQNWDVCWECLETIGLDAFRKYNLLKEGLYLRMRTLVYMDRWWDAFTICEESLEDILADQDLRELRQQLFDEVGGRFQSMKDRLGQHEQRLSQMESKHQAMFQTMEKYRRQHNTLQDVLQQKKSLQQQLSKAEKREKKAVAQARTKALQEHVNAKVKRVEEWASERPDVVQPLSESMHKILMSAEGLWQDLQLQPSQDHGPVVLQLARVVEGLVNRRLIDQLVGYTLKRGGRLSDFPPVAIGRLKERRNRLSLGDVANLLYSRKETIEADGTKSVEVNPQSSQAHHQALTQFWSSALMGSLTRDTLAFLRFQLPDLLRELAKVRNASSHAGRALSRGDAERVRVWVLGESKGEGILSVVGQVQEAESVSDE